MGDLDFFFLKNQSVFDLQMRQKTKPFVSAIFQPEPRHPKPLRRGRTAFGQIQKSDSCPPVKSVLGNHQACHHLFLNYIFSEPFLNPLFLNHFVALCQIDLFRFRRNCPRHRSRTLITLKRTVLAKGRHCPAVMMSPSWKTVTAISNEHIFQVFNFF